jgi:hypothetical protein
MTVITMIIYFKNASRSECPKRHLRARVTVQIMRYVLLRARRVRDVNAAANALPIYMAAGVTRDGSSAGTLHCRRTSRSLFFVALACSAVKKCLETVTSTDTPFSSSVTFSTFPVLYNRYFLTSNRWPALHN